MAIYVSSFISGFQEVIKELVLEYLKKPKIIHLFDGLIVYETEADHNRIRQIPFFSNSFLLIKQYDSYREFSSDFFDLDIHFLNRYLRKDRTFRLVFSEENEVVSADRSAVIPIEKKISEDLGLKLDIYNSDVEFWFLKRSEGKFFFMYRLTKSINSGLQKGEFRSDLCFILNYMAEPNSRDIFMEPFAGYGAIIQSRAKNFPAKMLVINDLDKKYNGFWNKKLDSFKNLNIVRKNQDVLNFVSEKDASTDKIIADPPWGDFRKLSNVEEFYQQMMKEFSRILRKRGILILLTSKKIEFEKILEGFKELSLVVKLDVLVNGKKVGIYKILKK